MILTPTQSHLDRFAGLSGDANPIHVDPDFSARTGFGRTVAHGAILTTWLMALQAAGGGQGTTTAAQFPAPAFAGEALETVDHGDGTWSLQRAGDGTSVCLLGGFDGSVPGAPQQEFVPARPLAVGMVAQARIGISGEQLAAMADLCPMGLEPVIAARALVLGGWSALLGMVLPGPGANYLKQQTVWEALDAGPNGQLGLSVTITGLRPDKHLVDLLTLAHDSNGRLVARGRALIGGRDVAGGWGG